MSTTKNRRILVIDDQESIREDFRKILAGDNGGEEELDGARSAFFGDVTPTAEREVFDLAFASQGEEGIERLHEACRDGKPFALAFVDVRMPPGLDGIATINRLWQSDADLQVVICTAYSDYSFDEIMGELGVTDRLLILKKPFDPVEVRQLAGALTEKWNGIQREREQMQALREANERAEAASKAKSEFLANMSHEIRTPMNALLGYVELLCDPDVTPTQQVEYGETIRRSGEHLLTILNDILDISRIEACRMVLNAADFKPLELTKEVASLMLTQAGVKDLDLSVEVDGKIPEWIESDRVRVRQILLNLVGNAIKFTDHGSVRVVLRTQGHADTSFRELCFDVIDTGIGIHEGKQVALFDAFTQADTSSTRVAGGTGLGLAISRRLALMLGGDIEMQSEYGKGSTFTFRLHVGDVVPQALVTYSKEECSLASQERATRLAAASNSLSGRVLLVEDVKFNQILMGAVLKKAGATVTVADNGQLGCEEFQRAHAAGEPYDIVLMDMQMPVMDGYDASRHLRAAGHRTPIVALTAHAMDGDRDRCIEAGCSDYATKPIDRVRLIDLCHRLLSLEGAEAPLPSADPAPEPSESQRESA